MFIHLVRAGGPAARSASYGKGFEAGPVSCRGRVLGLLWVFEVCGRFHWVPGRFSYPPDPILGSVFLWRCFCRQKTFLQLRICEKPSGEYGLQREPTARLHMSFEGTLLNLGSGAPVDVGRSEGFDFVQIHPSRAGSGLASYMACLADRSPRGPSELI